MSSVATGAETARPAPMVVASVCHDLGGSVRDWRKLLGDLKATYADATRWDRSEEGWQVNYRITHAPVILVESQGATLELSGLSAERTPVREIRIYPAGVIVFRYLMWADPSTDISGLYGIRRDFQHFRRAGYIAHLREVYGGIDERLDDLSVPEHDAGISMLDEVIELRARCKPFIEERPRIYPAQYARWALCMSPRPNRSGLEHDLSGLAQQKDLVYPADTVEGLINGDRVDTLRLRGWPGLVLASWEGIDVYVAADDAGMREAALDSFELSHQFAFLCRAWIDILDREPPTDIPEKMNAGDVKRLEAQMRKLSVLDRLMSASLIEVDSADVMFVDTFRLELAHDYAERFKLGRLRAMVFDRLDAMSRESAVARDILDRNYQQAVNEQGDRLQLLFAGAVAAQLAALVPATFALAHHLRLGLGLGVLALTITLWAGFVVVAMLFFSWSAPWRSHRAKGDGAGAPNVTAPMKSVNVSAKAAGASR